MRRPLWWLAGLLLALLPLLASAQGIGGGGVVNLTYIMPIAPGDCAIWANVGVIKGTGTGSCGSGSGTVSPGTAGQVAVYSSTGSVVSGGNFSGDCTASVLVLTCASLGGTPFLFNSLLAGEVLIYNGADIVNSGTQCAEVTANTNLSPTTPCVNVTTSGTVTITLPTAVAAQNPYTVSMDSSSTGTLVIATTSSQTINKAAPSAVNYRAGWSYDFVSNNANWTLH